MREIFLEPTSGQAKFVILELSSVIGGAGESHPLPWSALRFDERGQAYSTFLPKNDLKTSPAYGREQLADATYAGGEQTRRYFAEHFTR